MALLEEYWERRNNPPTDPAKRILFAVMDDILGRGGFDNAWDDTDSETREELLQTNLEIVQRNLSI